MQNIIYYLKDDKDKKRHRFFGKKEDFSHYENNQKYLIEDVIEAVEQQPSEADLKAQAEAEAKRKADKEAADKAKASQAPVVCSCKSDLEATNKLIVDLSKKIEAIEKSKLIQELQKEVKALKEGKATSPSPTPTPPPSGKAGKTPVNVNTATAAQLEPLPYIGATGAATIVRKRDEGGKFKDHADFKARTRYDFTSEADKPLITF